MVSTPAPSQTGQRPPLTLKKNGRVYSRVFWFHCFGEEFTDFVEHLDVGGGNWSAGSGPMGLGSIIHHFVDIFQAFDTVVGQRFVQRTVRWRRKSGIKGLVGPAWIFRAGNTGHHDKFAQRQIAVHFFEVMTRSTVERQLGPLAFPPVWGLTGELAFPGRAT